MCGSLTLIPQKCNLFMFQVIFFNEKRGEYECLAVAHHQDTALLQTGPLKKCITNRRIYVLKPCLQPPFFLLRFFVHFSNCSFLVTTPFLFIPFYFIMKIPYFCGKCSVVCFKYTCLFLFTPCLVYAHDKGLR